jgi:hypothetical protein
MARGFSPGSSQSLGSRLCMVTSVRPFSVPKQPVVAPLDGPPVELWCGADQGSSGDPPLLEGGARASSLRHGDGGCGN